MLDDVMKKAEGLLDNENVKDVVDKAKEFINSDKGKEVIENVKEKAEGFIKDKLGK